MGGGKEETYTDLQAQAIFDGGDNLYSKELVRLFAIYKKIDPATFTKDMIDASRKYFSAETFEALGVGVKNSAAVSKVTLDGIQNYIINNFGVNKHAVYYFATADANSNEIKADAYKIVSYLRDNYNEELSYQKSFSYIFDMKVKPNSAYGCPAFDALQIFQSIHNLSPNEDIDTVSINIETNAYELEAGKWYGIKDGVINLDPITNEWLVTMEELDNNWVPTGNEKVIIIPEDFRPIYLSRFAYTDDCQTWTEHDSFIFYKEDVIGVAYTYRFFIFPIKDDSQFIDNPEYLDVLLSDMGLGNGVLEDSLGDSKIVKSILTYSTEFDYSPFLPYFSEVYGTDGNRNQVIFNTDNYVIEYNTIYGEFGSYVINFDGYTFDAFGRNIAMVPVDIMMDFTMPQRYALLKDMMRIWANVSETVKLKWYQTGFFKFLTIIVTATIAAFTGQWQLLAIAAGVSIGFKVFGEYLPPELMAVAAVVVAIFTVDFSGIAKSIASIANLSNNISQVYFIQEQGKILDQIESNKEMAKANAEALKEMQKDTLYIPFDSYSSYFNTMYDSLYNSYDGLYDTMTNYDRLLKPTAGVKI